MMEVNYLRGKYCTSRNFTTFNNNESLTGCCLERGGAAYGVETGLARPTPSSITWLIDTGGSVPTLRLSFLEKLPVSL